MGIVTATLINGNYIFFDLDSINNFCFDYDHNIVTVEMTDLTCYNCKIDSLFLYPTGISLADFCLLEDFIV